ncbi:MAG TPA: NAD-dependent epimerase/dehydratase family protein [Candidatus Dormibacteraeota bacterium]|nr:NAD-dependent epimerase/dehydratase family protein [Candidatus Dormibacteraeota bacterium]
MIDLERYIRALRGPILVTGGSGFIGANLFKTIAAHRKDVFAVEQRAKSWRLADVNDEHVFTVDLTDKAATKNLVESTGVQTVFDCVAYGAYSFEQDVDKIYRTNFSALVNITEMLARVPFAAYVHAGTSSEYGTNCTAPPESGPFEPNSYYAVSKLAAANHLHFLGKQKAFPCLNLRLYSVYGPLEDTSRLIPQLLRSALKGQYPTLVDARVSRDFIHVDDVCRAFIVAAAKMNPAFYGESLNIGTGRCVTVGELALLAKDVFGLPGEPEFGSMPNRAWDLAHWYADAGKAQRMLDWTASISLEDGLKKTASWVAGLDDRQFKVVTDKSAQKRKRSVSAIVACYKDERAIPLMHERLTTTFRKLGIDYEIIFVDDSSPDGDAAAIREITARDPRVVGISHSRNFGSQMAFRSGMELSTKDAVVLLDGDLQDPPELIEAFYERWEQGSDVVFGRRVKRDMPFAWELLYKAFYRVFSAFSYVPIPLDAGDFSLMDRRVVGWLLACTERDLFVRGLRAYVGFKQTGIDYVRPERAFGRSTNNILRNIEWAKRGIFSFSNTPLAMLTTLGVAALGISMLIAVIEALLRIFVPGIAPKGITTVLIAILLFGSFNLFAVGVVGEYVAKIMTEVKGRPRLIRSGLIRDGEVTDLLPDGRVR